jgi:hypothetical protein
VAAGSVPLSSLMLGGDDGMDLYWLEGRAAEAGRNALQRLHGEQIDELTPAPFNVRTRVHEYGGGAYAVAGDTVFFSNFADNRLYMQRGDGDAPSLHQCGAAALCRLCAGQ